MARFALRWILPCTLLLWGAAPGSAEAYWRAPGPAVPAVVTSVHRVAADRTTPVVRPRGPLHAAKPLPDRLPLPLPPPLPDQATTAPAPAAAPAVAAKPPPAEAQKPKPEGSGLPLPRFAALRTDDVNMRAGPGFRYPIVWVYKRRDLPMEIEREFEVWRLVADPDGIRGWVHEATLTGRRTFMVKDAEATLRADPNDDAHAVAKLMPGVIGRIRSCAAGSAWCRVQAGQYGGWLKRAQIWGVLPDEAVGQ